MLENNEDDLSIPKASEFENNKVFQKITLLRQEISKVLIGQDEVVSQVIAALLADGHVLLEGVPGLGKTLLVRILSKVFSLNFNRIQFTPDLMPADIVGHAMFNMKSGEFETRKGPVFTNFLLSDEINRAPAKTQAALLEVMQEKQVTIESHSYKIAPPFMVLATQNPIEQEGTYPLPEAQLDRFLIQINIDYPTLQEEIDLVKLATQDTAQELDSLSKLNVVMSSEELLELQQLTSKVVVDQSLYDYAVEIVRQTRTWKGIRIGVGPRGAISLIKLSKSQAILNGRSFVIPDDIKDMAVSALAHRIQLSAEMEIEGIHKAQVLHDLLNTVAAPRT